MIILLMWRAMTMMSIVNGLHASRSIHAIAWAACVQVPSWSIAWRIACCWCSNHSSHMTLYEINDVDISGIDAVKKGKTLFHFGYYTNTHFAHSSRLHSTPGSHLHNHFSFVVKCWHAFQIYQIFSLSSTYFYCIVTLCCVTCYGLWMYAYFTHFCEMLNYARSMYLIFVPKFHFI